VKFEVHGLLCSAKRVKETGRKDKSEPLALTFRYFNFCRDDAQLSTFARRTSTTQRFARRS